VRLQPTCLEITDIDGPHKGSVQLIPAYAQANAEFMREQEVRTMFCSSLDQNAKVPFAFYV
jgi:hypothetical protein